MSASNLIPLPKDIDPLEFSRSIAAAALPDAVNMLIMRVSDNTISTAQLQSGIDQLGKISGLYAKQEQKAQGPGFSIKIVLGSGSSSEKTINIGGSHDVFDQVPSFMSGSSGNLSQIEAFCE